MNKEDNRRHQTWGEFANEKMLLMRNGVVEGKPVKQRMVWYNITENNFQWNWERSDDDGFTWFVVWKINYQRKI